MRIDRLKLEQLLAIVVGSIRRRTAITVMYVNVHCMNVAREDSEYARILDAADLVYCDGTGVRLGARISGQHLPARLTGADWIDDLCRLAVQRQLTLYLLGGESGSAEEAAAVLTKRYAGLRIAGTAAGFELNQATVLMINQTAPDILLVGMGTPTQEKWIAHYRQSLQVPVVWAVGALFDFVSGRLPRGPRILTEHGLEWLCRLAAEPRKLWRRYLIGNPAFFWRVIREYGVRRLGA